MATVPKLTRPPVLEKTIERAFVRKVEKLGCLTRKLNGEGARSWPDRLVLGPGGFCAFIEFKRPGGKLTDAQFDLAKKMKSFGLRAELFDDADAAFEYVKGALKEPS